MQPSRLPLFFRDAAARSAWGDYRALLIFAIASANRALIDSFRQGG